MPGPLSNPKHEHFAQLIAEEKLCDLDAYAEAGFKRHKGSASRLRNSAHICERIGELQERAAKRHDVTVESIITELEEARAVAKEEKQSSAMVSASKAKAQIAGVWTERMEIDANVKVAASDMTDEQLDEHIKRLSERLHDGQRGKD